MDQSFGNVRETMMQEIGWFRALSDDGQQFDILELPAKKKEGSGPPRS